jgi:hypothetical protein
MMTRPSSSGAKGTVKRTGDSQGPSPAAIGAVVAVAVIVAGAWYAWSGDDRVAATLELQKKVLSEGVSPRQQQVAIDRIIRNVDTMPADDVQAIRDAIIADLRQVHERSIDAYFAAPLAEKQAVLDRAIDREAVLAELRFAVGNNSFGSRRRRPPKPAPAKVETKAAAEVVSDAEKELAKQRREMANKYFDALEARATQRGVKLSARR